MIQKIEWSSEYSVGNDLLDKEHRVISGIFNDLVDVIRYNKSRSEFAEVLSRLTDYAMEHFRHEEAYMEKMNYPLLSEHQQRHMEFTLEIARFNADFMSYYPPSAQRVYEFLSLWWFEHIRKEDMRYKEFQKTQNSKIYMK
jgi:hemerythrin-like metal-binding protein